MKSHLKRRLIRAAKNNPVRPRPPDPQLRLPLTGTTTTIRPTRPVQPFGHGGRTVRNR